MDPPSPAPLPDAAPRRPPAPPPPSRRPRRTGRRGSTSEEQKQRRHVTWRLKRSSTCAHGPASLSGSSWTLSPPKTSCLSSAKHRHQPLPKRKRSSGRPPYRVKDIDINQEVICCLTLFNCLPTAVDPNKICKRNPLSPIDFAHIHPSKPRVREVFLEINQAGELLTSCLSMSLRFHVLDSSLKLEQLSVWLCLRTSRVELGVIEGPTP